MVGNGVNRDDDDPVIRLDVLWMTLRRSRHWILGVTLGVTLLVAAVGGVYLAWLQPVRTVATLEFAPTFKGASDVEPTYPNGVPFSEADILGGLVLDKVHARSQLGDFCALDTFKSAFFVDRQSTEAIFLASDYESRLAAPQISPIERSQLEREYQSKRRALPVAFRLAFVKPTECAALPATLVGKALTDTLTVWADDSQRTRGVLSLPIAKFSPGAFAIGSAEGIPQVARGDFMRTQLVRILANADQVARAPGSTTVRLETGDSIAEVRAGLVDLIHTIEPLISSAVQAGGRGAVRWAQSRLASAQMTLQTAQGEADVYRRALADYSAQPSITGPTAKMPARPSTDSPEVVPQIDQSFIASIMSLAEGNVKYRQELTDKLVLAGIQADPYRTPVLFYRHLLDDMTRGERSSLSEPEIDARFTAIATEAKALTTRFNELIDEISRVTLSASDGLYRTANPVSIRAERPFSMNLYLAIVAVAFFATLVLMIVWALVRGRMQEMAKA